MADENPGGVGNFDLPLRLPGQYSDSETNLSYNIGRDYSSEIGRYVESDPLGLGGGSNVYLYANATPMLAADRLGLEWVFVRWETEQYSGWWSQWRRLLALCYETCTKIMNKEEALYQQWRPIGINTTPVPSYDPFPKAGKGVGGAMDAMADLAKAMQQAREQGSKSKEQLIIEDPAAGARVCKQLPLPPGAEGKCCPDTR